VLSSAARASVKSLAAVSVGYPLVIDGLAARIRPPMGCSSNTEPTRDTEPASDAEPPVSVIIATCNDEAAVRIRIADCLRCADAPGKLEVIVAVDRRCPAAAARYLTRLSDSASADGRCTVVLGDNPGGKAAALNAAVRATRGEILVFTDTRRRFQAGAIRHLVAALRNPRVGAVSGALDFARANGSASSLISRYPALERWLHRCKARVHSAVAVSGTIWATWKSFWAPLPSDLILDDSYTPMRIALGRYRVAFAEAARAVETRQIQVGYEYRRTARLLTGVIQRCAWQPAVLVPLLNPIWPVPQ
jgi:glycosyl transferase family 2